MWIGMVEVKCPPQNDILDGAKGAYVNIVAPAASEKDFYHQVEKAVKSLDLNLVNIDDAEPLSQRMTDYQVDEEIEKIAQEATEQNSLRFGTFHTFVDDKDE
jgi:hypothetical protein